MLRKLLNRLFGPFSSGGVIPLGEFLILLQKSYAYLRKHRYRVLSTELPDDLLKKWLMPMPGEKQAEEYKRSFPAKTIRCPKLNFPCSYSTMFYKNASTGIYRHSTMPKWKSRAGI